MTIVENACKLKLRIQQQNNNNNGIGEYEMKQYLLEQHAYEIQPKLEIMKTSSGAKNVLYR